MGQGLAKGLYRDGADAYPIVKIHLWLLSPSTPSTSCSGLYWLSAGLYSLVKRAPKAKRKRITFEVAGPAKSNVPLDARARSIFAYFKKYNYEVVNTGDVITFRGQYKASRGQAAAISFYVFVGEEHTPCCLEQIRCCTEGFYCCKHACWKPTMAAFTGRFAFYVGLHVAAHAIW